MKFLDLSKENLDKLAAARNAIIKLESGGTIVQNSDEHKALTWAVLSLTGEMLFDNQPLTDKEIEYAERLAKESC